MTAHENEINNIRKDSITKMLTTELQFSTDPEIKTLILEYLQKQSDLNGKTPAQTELDNVCINMVQASLKNKWTKLSSDEKLNRIEHYVCNMNSKDKKKILDLFKSGKIKSTQIEYNSKDGCVTNIKDL
jgi:plasmid rolling circle replication initiator protein Rep